MQPHLAGDGGGDGGWAKKAGRSADGESVVRGAGAEVDIPARLWAEECSSFPSFSLGNLFLYLYIVL